MTFKRLALTVTCLLFAAGVHASTVRLATVDAPECLRGEAFFPGFAAAPDGTIARLETCSSGVFVLTATDGGQTWHEAKVSDFPMMFFGGSIAFNDDGVIEAAYSDFGALLLRTRSTDGGVTWTAGTELPVSLFWEFTHAIGSGERSAIAHSDGGQVTVNTTVDGVGWNDYSFVGANPEIHWLAGDTLLACWLDVNNSKCSYSSDGGVTFSTPVIAMSWSSSNDAVVGLASNGPTDVVLIGGDRYRLQATRSLDGGQTWSAPVTIETGNISRPDVSFAADGSIWVTGYVNNDHYILHHSDDGVTWAAAPLPSPFENGCEVVEFNFDPVVQGLADGGILLALPRQHRAPSPSRLQPATNRSHFVHQTGDGGATWGEVMTAGARAPIQDTVVARMANGRLLAVWTEGPVGVQKLATSFSDDDGLTWSPTAFFNDVPVAPAQDEPFGGLNPYAPEAETPAPAVQVLAALDGSVSVLWLSRTQQSCFEVRVSRSPDGELWQPSIALGQTTELVRSPISMATDDRGRMVAMWRDGDSLMASRSLDHENWSPAFEIAPWDGGRCAVTATSNLVQAGDGSLVFLASLNDCDPNNFGLFRSESAGFSWEQRPTVLDINGSDIPEVIRMVAAGERLVASIGAPVGPTLPVFESFETKTFGEPTWDKMASTIRPDDLVAGDLTGNVYHVDIDNIDHRLVVSIDGRDEPLPIATLPVLGTLFPGCEMRAPLDLGMLHTDWDADDPGVFYTRLVGKFLRRDDSIRTLATRPDYATIFPLQPYRGEVYSGMWEPEDLLHDDSRPLVLYQVDDVEVLKLKKFAGFMITLHW